MSLKKCIFVRFICLLFLLISMPYVIFAMECKIDAFCIIGQKKSRRRVLWSCDGFLSEHFICVQWYTPKTSEHV